MFDRILTRRGLWLFVAAFLGTLVLTTSRSTSLDFQGALVVLGVLGVVSSLVAAARPRSERAEAAATAVVILWCLFRPLSFLLGPVGATAGVMSIAAIWLSILFLFLALRQAVERLNNRAP